MFLQSADFQEELLREGAVLHFDACSGWVWVKVQGPMGRWESSKVWSSQVSWYYVQICQWKQTVHFNWWDKEWEIGRSVSGLIIGKRRGHKQILLESYREGRFFAVIHFLEHKRMRDFFLSPPPALLRYNWHITSYKPKIYNVLIWYIYIPKWLPP